MKDLVLIIEDNLVQQKVLKSYFEDVLGNYTVEIFSKPADLNLHMKKRPFAVVLDHCFETGTKTGLEYLKEFRKRHTSIPVIYHTTVDDDTIRTAATALGIEQYILKDSTSFIRLRAVLDAIHEKVIYKKGYWKRTFIGMFDGF